MTLSLNAFNDLFLAVGLTFPTIVILLALVNARLNPLKPVRMTKEQRDAYIQAAKRTKAQQERLQQGVGNFLPPISNYRQQPKPPTNSTPNGE